MVTKITKNAKRPPFRVSPELYDRTCRGMLAAVERRSFGIVGIGVADDVDARWWRAWSLAGLRQACALSQQQNFAPAPVPAPENGEPAAARIHAPLSPVRSRSAAADQREPRGPASAGLQPATQRVKKPGRNFTADHADKHGY